MSEEGLRWRVTKAVRAAKKESLPAPAKLVMLVLADIADVGTAEIPERWTPSLTVLCAETGLSRSTVALHLKALEKDGWIVRIRPTTAEALGKGERTRYQLCIPSAGDGPSTEDLVREPDHLVRENDIPSAADGQPSAGDALRDRSSSDRSQTKTRSRSKALAVVDRPEVERLCIHLADRIEGNGSKRPTITKAWRDAARRLLDRDNRTEEQVMRAIDWCQDDEFWRANILSMPKLRERYDALRLQAQRQAATKKSTTDQRFADAQALKAKFRGKVS